MGWRNRGKIHSGWGSGGEMTGEIRRGQITKDLQTRLRGLSTLSALEIH